MNRGLRLALLACVAVLAAAAPAAAQSRIDRRFPIDRDAYVKVYLLQGVVQVVGWEKDSIAVTGTVDSGRLFSGGSGKSAKLGLWEDPGAEPGSGRLEVRVPAGATVWVKSEAARVSVTGITGGVDVYSVTGDIRAEGKPRQLYAESMGGEVSIEASAASIRAKTAAGSITFRGRAEDLLLSTVSGTIDAAAGTPLRARIETVTGAIRWQGGVERGGALEFQTHSGPVGLALPADLDAEVSVATIRGSVSGRPGSGGSTPAAGRPTLDVLAGAGGARIDVRSFSGEVTFLER